MEVIGRTVDDAAGEAFDKIAKYMNLGYPGGPVIEKLALRAPGRGVLFPKILPEPGDTRFSYSGIKTAVINYLKANPDADPAGVVHGFQERVLEILVRRAFAAARERGIRSLVVAGGVAANGRLRRMLNDEARAGEEVIIASPLLCTDNAAMVAGIGYRYYASGRTAGLDADVHARA